MHVMENKGGFSTFKTRDTGRGHGGAWLDTTGGRLGPLSNAKWLPLIKKILGQDACLRHAGVIMAMPNAVAQKWHSDGDHIDEDIVLPPHALNVFVPLVKCDVSNGGTEFVPGTHADWTASSHSYVLDAAPGDALVADWRLKAPGFSEQNERRPAPAVPDVRETLVRRQVQLLVREAERRCRHRIATRSERDIRDARSAARGYKGPRHQMIY